MTERERSELFAEAAREMRAETDVQQTLDRAVGLATGLIEACDQAGVCLVQRNRRIDTSAATSDEVRRLDALQYELGAGPCLDAIWQEQTVSVPDVANDQRWPEWGKRAAEHGVRSLLCLRLFTDHDTLGALNLYSGDVDAFDEDDRAEGLSLAAHVAVALAAARDVENLNIAVANRTVIGQAEGMLMERFDLTADQAFAVLRRVSQEENVKLYTVANELVSSRKTPGS